MKRILCFILISVAFQGFTQNYPVSRIAITIPSNPDANTANWGGGTSFFMISASTQLVNGHVEGSVVESKLLVTIKKDGAKSCGSYTGNSAPASNFNTPTKVWGGNNATAYLGKDCVLTPGDYELCVQFFGYGAAGAAPLSEEKFKPFTIRAVEQITYQPPQPVSPADGTELSESALLQPIVLRWISVIPKPKEPVTYRVSVWQLMEGQTSVQAMKANTPLFARDVDNITQTILNNLVSVPCIPPYLCDFIWNVQALNRDGKPIGENSGTSVASVFNFRNEKYLENTSGYPCNDLGVSFMEKRKIYKGDSVSSSFMEKRKIYTGDSVSSGSMDKRKIYIGHPGSSDFMDKRKIYKGDSVSFNCEIINKYSGSEEQLKPKAFIIRINDNYIIVAADQAAQGWTRTPSKFPPGTSAIKWTNNSGDIPQGMNNLGSICLENIKNGPATVLYEYLNKEEKVICSGTFVINSTAGEPRDTVQKNQEK